MKILHPTTLRMVTIFSLLIFLSSCSKDSDLFFEYVNEQIEEEIEESDNNPDEDTDSDDDNADSPGDNDDPQDNNPDDNENPNSNNNDRTPLEDLPDWIDWEPSGTKPSTSDTYHPTSSSDISNPNNAGKTAIIDNSFDCSGCNFAQNQLIVPEGGIISGQNINLNGSYIDQVPEQAFANSVTFSNVYQDSWVYPEVFGAISGDGQSDDGAIDALIRNVQYATALSNGSYVKNFESTYSRGGLFVWDMNNSAVETTINTNLSHGSAASNDSKYLMFFNGLNAAIINGEFDGNDIASRCIQVDRQELFIFDNLYVHNYFAPANAYARGVAFRLNLRADANSNFRLGSIANCEMVDIGAFSDGNANNAPFGISKGIWASLSGNQVANVYFQNNLIDNIYGDDAEGFYSDKLWGGSYNYNSSQTNLIFDNERYVGCQRRAMKITTSNAFITNSSFESASNAPIFAGAQATLIHVFSTSGSNQPLRNVSFTNNEVRIKGSAQNNPVGFTDIADSVFENNSIICDNFTAYSFIGFGTGISNPYSGDFENVSFSNNEIVNAFIHIDSVFDPINGGPVVDGNTFDLTWSTNPGAYLAVVRIFKSSGTSPGFTISNTVINANLTTTTGLNLFGGVFNTWGAEPKNYVFDNVDINYSGQSPVYPFAYTGKNNTSASFDSTNRILNCDISGAVGTGAIFVKGSNESVQISNSFGDNGTALTVQ